MHRSTAILGISLIALILASCDVGSTTDETVAVSKYVNSGFSTTAPSTWGTLNCHDPALFKDDDGTWYVFSTDASIGGGWDSGIQIRKSSDLITWTCLSTPAIPNGYWDADMLTWCGYTNDGNTVNGAKSSNAVTWAPCVIKLGGKYLMYHGIITDADTTSGGPRAWIGLAIADKVTGPYRPAHIYNSTTYPTTSTVVRYTYQNSDSDGVDSACLNEGNGGWVKGIGCIDPHVVYDDSEKMWMNYGSWKGGLAILELDTATGMPVVAPADTVSGGTGSRITSDNATGPAIEGACVMNFTGSDYYWLFNSNGNVESDYSVHLSRTAKANDITGAYADSNGNAMLSTTWSNFHSYGNKILGGFRFGSEYGWRAPGGQSIVEDADSGKIFFASHARTSFLASYYIYLQIRQMYFNADGWPVLNPNEYNGESLRAMTASEVAGTYDAVLTVRNNTYGSFTDYDGTVSASVNVSDANQTDSTSWVLTATSSTGGTVSGAYSGTWTLSDNDDGTQCRISIVLTGKGTFNGIVTDATDSARKDVSLEMDTICFTTFDSATSGEYFFGNKHNF